MVYNGITTLDNTSSAKILGKIGLAIIAIALADLAFLNYWVVKNDKKLSSFRAPATATPSASPRGTEVAADEDVGEESPEPSPSPVTVSQATKETSLAGKTETVVQTAQKEIFLPLGSGSTKSATYAELAGAEITIDFSKYSAVDSMVFEASVWVDGGNGRAWGELYNVDGKTLLIESQISNPTGSGVLKTSGSIPVPGGAKTYRVYAKTDLTDYAAHVDNARIKITLR